MAGRRGAAGRTGRRRRWCPGTCLRGPNRKCGTSFSGRSQQLLSRIRGLDAYVKHQTATAAGVPTWSPRGHSPAHFIRSSASMRSSTSAISTCAPRRWPRQGWSRGVSGAGVSGAGTLQPNSSRSGTKRARWAMMCGAVISTCTTQPEVIRAIVLGGGGGGGDSRHLRHGL